MPKFDPSDGQLAAEMWTQEQYCSLLTHLHGDAPPNHFAHSFIGSRDGYGVTSPVFVHNKTRSVETAKESTWKAIAGNASKPYALVLLPWSCRSSWCVWDLDFHAEPSKRFGSAVKRDLRAFIREAAKLKKQGLGYLVEDSCRGWHCWLISDTQRGESEWKAIKAQIESQACFRVQPEFLPLFGGKTKGGRAPGAANPNTWHVTREDWETSRIHAHSLPPLLELKTKDVSSLSKEKKPCIAKSYSLQPQQGLEPDKCPTPTRCLLNLSG